MERVRTKGFRLFNLGGRFKSKKTLIISIFLIIVLVSILYLFITTKYVENKTYDHLKNNYVELSQVKKIIVKYSFINFFLSYNEWTISVEYYDEPNVHYMYTYKDKMIIATGVAGGKEIENKSDYKHLEIIK